MELGGPLCRSDRHQRSRSRVVTHPTREYTGQDRLGSGVHQGRLILACRPMVGLSGSDRTALAVASGLRVSPITHLMFSLTHQRPHLKEEQIVSAARAHLPLEDTATIVHFHANSVPDCAMDEIPFIEYLSNKNGSYRITRIKYATFGAWKIRYTPSRYTLIGS